MLEEIIDDTARQVVVTTKQNKDTQIRPYNWLVAGRLLRKIPLKEVLICFEFKEDIKDPNVMRRTKDALRRYESDSRLPVIAREFAGLHMGLLPPGGIAFDTKLFTMLCYKYIITNKINEGKVGFTPVRINEETINSVLPELIQQQRKVDPDFKNIIYSKTMDQCFRRRWYIDGITGTFNEPKPVKLGPAWEFTKYATDKKYDVDSDADSVSNCTVVTDESSANDLLSLSQNNNLSDHMNRINVLRVLHPYFKCHEHFMHIVGVQSDNICTHKKPILKVVHSLCKLWKERSELSLEAWSKEIIHEIMVITLLINAQFSEKEKRSEVEKEVVEEKMESVTKKNRCGKFEVEND